MNQKIIVTGSVAYDRIMNFPGRFKDQILPDKIHMLNVSFFVQALKESFGGTAGNIAYNLALLGMKPTIVANVGVKDFILYESWLKKNRIDTSGIQILPNQQTAGAYIITDQDDNQIAGFFPGAMLQPIFNSLKAKSYQLSAELAIVSPQNPVDMVRLPALFKKKKIPYIFDPGQQITSLSGSQLRPAITGSRVTIGNDYEINLIMKKTGWSDSMLRRKTELLITTLGDKGSMMASKEKSIRIPAAKPKNTSDPTGAGDAYRAGLMYGLLKGWPLSKIGRLASVVSIYTVEKYGTQTHSFTWPQLHARYRQNFGEPL